MATVPPSHTFSEDAGKMVASVFRDGERHSPEPGGSRPKKRARLGNDVGLLDLQVGVHRSWNVRYEGCSS